MTTPNVPGYSGLERLGAGGFAEVFRATQDAVGRQVALKLLHASMADEETERRFARECRVVGSLSWHPHIAAVLDAGVDNDGRSYLVFELLDGGSLGDRLEKSGPLSWGDAITYTIQTADAVAAAHEQEVLHRDIKPDNVLLDRLGRAKLADFGIAQMRDGNQTKSGVITATLAHAAPEILTGQRADKLSDVYLLGSTLFELIAGEPPFGKAIGDDFFAAIQRIVSEPPPLLTDVVPGCPPDVAEAIDLALRKAPEHRPQSAGAFGHLLRDVQRAHGLSVTEMPFVDTSQPAAPAPPAPPTPPPAAPTPPAPPTPPTPPPAAPAPPAPPTPPTPLPAAPAPPAPAPSAPAPPPVPAPAPPQQPPVAPPPVPAHATQAQALEPVATSLQSIIDRVASLADRQGRQDLADRARIEARSLATPESRVLICGDFKQGKSTLVNTLIDQDLCPTDADIATGVPTILRYGRELRIVAHREVVTDNAAIDAPVSYESVPLLPSELVSHVTETAERPEGFALVHSCEIEVPTPWMDCGIELVDLPGAGGLDSPHGVRATTELLSADAVIFVCDASQELTQPELEFLARCVSYCPSTYLVVTKIDLYPSWRKIVDLNRGHLERAGLHVPVLPLSSMLYRLGLETGDERFLQEGGIDELRSTLVASVVTQCEMTASLRSAQLLDELLGQLGAVVAAGRSSTDPAETQRVIRDLERALAASQGLFLPSAAWLRRLDDGIVDLRHGADDDMSRHVTAITRQAQETIEGANPAEIWADFQDWLRREASDALASTYTSMGEATEHLANQIDTLLAAEEDQAFGGLGADGGGDGWFAAVDMADLGASGGLRKRNRIAFEGAAKGAATIASLGSWVPGLGPFSLAIGAVAFLTYGRKAARDRKAAELKESRALALDQVDDFLDEARRLAKRETERHTATVYRELRDASVRRLEQSQRSVEDALDRARANDGADAATLAQRNGELDEVAREVAGLRSQLDPFLTPGAAGGDSHV